MENFISKKELSERVIKSRQKEEIITVIVEPGTKDRIKDQGLRLSSYVRKLIEEDLKKRESN